MTQDDCLKQLARQSELADREIQSGLYPEATVRCELAKAWALASTGFPTPTQGEEQ